MKLKVVTNLIICCMLLYGCTNNNGQKLQGRGGAAIDDIYREQAEILSLKYNIAEDKMFKLISEVEDIHSKKFDYILAAKTKENPSVPPRYELLAEKYNISKNTLGSLIVDYYALGSYFSK